MSAFSDQSRRRFLRGLGAVLTLPVLESARPFAPAFAAASGGKVLASGAHPLRMAYIYAPNGVNLAKWWPKGTGTDYVFSDTLKPLEALRDQFQIIGGLDHDKARANGDGAGDHARANATYLTGCQARKTAGSDIKVGVSVDQIAASQIGGTTRVASLEMSTDRARLTGACDSGYSCAYQYNLSWSGESTPMPPESNPRMIFERLFGAGLKQEDAGRRAQRRSVLDFVMEDAKRMENRLDNRDKQKLDEYFTAVRDVERRIDLAETTTHDLPEGMKPTGIPETYREHIRLMYDMMLLAFQTDATRVSTYLLAYDGSNRPFPELNISEGHHSLSHHKQQQENLKRIAAIDLFYVEEFARFMERMKATSEGEGSLLDNCMIVYGSGIADGNRHNNDNLPTILAGKGGGTLTPGRFWQAKEGTPMTNLYLAMMERAGVNAERIGDSTGILQGI